MSITHQKLLFTASQEGEVCGKPCHGVIAIHPVENCSCHINPPCSPCTEPRAYCPVCDWEEKLDGAFAKPLRLFITNDFKGHNPVGTAAVVLAHDEVAALNKIKQELRAHGLEFDGTLVEVDITKMGCVVLNDGEY